MRVEIRNIVDIDVLEEIPQEGFESLMKMPITTLAVIMHLWLISQKSKDQKISKDEIDNLGRSLSITPEVFLQSLYALRNIGVIKINKEQSLEMSISGVL